MPLIDSHCHLSSFREQGVLTDILNRAQREGLEGLVVVGTDSSDWSVYRGLAECYPDLIHYTVGIHPCHVEAGWQEQAGGLASFFIPPRTPVALGEIGLDYFHLPKEKGLAAEVVALQREAFASQLDIAGQLDCPVIIHSRHAFEDCLTMIDQAGLDWRKVVFHCFAEGPTAMRKLNERGGRGSFTGIVTYGSAENVRDALLEQGIEQLMLETDCPYLTPVPHRGKPNEPAFLRHTAEYCARFIGMDLVEFEAQVCANTRGFFGI